MSDKNFNSIQKFDVPQAWIDNALNVPLVTSRKKPIIFVNFTRTLVAVASLVFVCALSVVMFFLNEDAVIPPIDVIIEPTSVTQSADTKARETESATKNKKPTESTQYIGSIEPVEETVSSTEKVSETKPSSTVTPTKTPVTQPIKPDSTFVPVHTEPDEPINPDPSEPEAPVDPTEPWAPDPWVPQPTQPQPTEKPNETKPPTPPKPTDNKDSVYVSTAILNSRLTGNKNIYCKVYDSKGNLLGNPNLFSSQHTVEIQSQTSSITIVCYYPYRQNVIKSSGVYTFYFYNEDGVTVSQVSRNFY